MLLFVVCCSGDWLRAGMMTGPTEAGETEPPADRMMVLSSCDLAGFAAPEAFPLDLRALRSVATVSFRNSRSNSSWGPGRGRRGGARGGRGGGGAAHGPG